MDLASLPTPVFTALDASTQTIAAACYLVVGIAAWLAARHDIRTRVFLGLSVANTLVFGVPTVWWLRGTSNPAQLPPGAIALMMAGFAAGALFLFHFTQVFPWRRPWIESSGPQMIVAYVVAPVAAASLVWFAPATPETLGLPYILAVIVFGFPLLVLLGIVLPVAAMVSLVRSYWEMPQAGRLHLKRPMQWLLVSQVAGGTLGIVFAPVLTVIAPNSLMQSGLTVIMWALGLLTPIAFAAAIWKYGLLSQ